MLLDGISLVRTTFISAAFIVFLAYLTPALRSRFIDYGPRSSTSQLFSAELEKKRALKQKDSSRSVDSMLDRLAEVQVPHNWFASFYAISIALSLFWIVILPFFPSYLFGIFLNLDQHSGSTPFTRTQLASMLMLVQGVRRFIECRLYTISSTSTMWFGHWLVGLLFYVGMSVAIWIEGVPALLQHEFTIRDIEITTPSWRTALAALLFMFASGIQHDCHAYLASLKHRTANTTSEEDDYQFPTFPAFNLTLTPHYFMECLIYLSLSIVAAPEEHWFNGTLLCALVFVVTNLGVTAVGTRIWYVRKFGGEKVGSRWAMIPYVL